MKQWFVSPVHPPEFSAALPDFPPVVRQLLWNRGFQTAEACRQFLNPNYVTHTHDPFLFRDMPLVVERLFRAIDEKEKIVIHGDYDADGVSASVILYTTLKMLGANLEVFLPHRETDGYGLNLNTVTALAETGAKIIITCDCGISNVEEITEARRRGIDVIVTDHHQIPPALPSAFAILHPKIATETYPDKTLSGGGVAFKLAQAMLQEAENKTRLPSGISREGFEKWLLDMVAISSVADMVPLLGETRVLTRFGLTVIAKTKRVGLAALMKTAGLFDENGVIKRTVTSQTIGFQIAPRINAAGRMRHARAAFDLLTEENMEAAALQAAALHGNNTDRQKLTEEMIGQARALITERGLNERPLICVFEPSWSVGIIGLVASKLKDEFYRPVMAMAEVNGAIVGSGRSIPEWNMIAGIQTIPQFFKKFGGHPQACGFTLASVEVLPDFESALCAMVSASLSAGPVAPKLELDTELALNDLSWDLLDQLKKFEPFGVGNSEPRFVAHDCEIIDAAQIGSTKKHLRLIVKQNGKVQKMIGFGFGGLYDTLKPGTRADLAFEIDENEWNGFKEIECRLIDVRTI
ncbi:MAG: single-stranded-DNA-specific exonuclease RecJ [Candidatus Magasanikbacteria bacterium]|nr:single-stranded-DNA-specific exonuclease RecJ [Candidatus Magasanikbacteria bacterium]